MTIVCVDNTPIMLQSLKENADKAYPCADVQTFLSAESALEYAEKFEIPILRMRNSDLLGWNIDVSLEKVSAKINHVINC